MAANTAVGFNVRIIFRVSWYRIVWISSNFASIPNRVCSPRNFFWPSLSSREKAGHLDAYKGSTRNMTDDGQAF